MKLYFRIIGLLLLIDWCVGLFILITYLTSNNSQLDNNSRTMMIVLLVTIIIVGPALGLLFISYARLKRNIELADEEFKETMKTVKELNSKLMQRQSILQYELDELKRKLEEKS